MNVQILAQEVEHQLVFVGPIENYEASNLSNHTTKIYLGSDSKFENIVVFRLAPDLDFILDSDVEVRLAFARNFVVAMFNYDFFVWRNNWPEAKKFHPSIVNTWMQFHEDRFIFIIDDTCLVYVSNKQEEIKYEGYPDIISDIKVVDGKLQVELWGP